MDPTPSLQNIPATPPITPISPPTPPKNPNFLLPILSLVLLVSLAFSALLYYKNTQIQKRLDDFVATNQPPPTPTSQPETETDETADWKTYTNQKHQLSFNYPTDWQLSSNSRYQIIGTENEKLTFNEDGGLMNECMETISTSQINIANQTFTKKIFRGVKSGQMCLGDTLGNNEIWIQPLSEKYGLQFSYLESNAKKSEATFNQILSTFKFLN